MNLLGLLLGYWLGGILGLILMYLYFEGVFDFILDAVDRFHGIEYTTNGDPIPQFYDKREM